MNRRVLTICAALISLAGCSERSGEAPSASANTSAAAPSDVTMHPAPAATTDPRPTPPPADDPEGAPPSPQAPSAAASAPECTDERSPLARNDSCDPSATGDPTAE